MVSVLTTSLGPPTSLTAPCYVLLRHKCLHLLITGFFLDFILNYILSTQYLMFGDDFSWLSGYSGIAATSVQHMVVGHLGPR